MSSFSSAGISASRSCSGPSPSRFGGRAASAALGRLWVAEGTIQTSSSSSPRCDRPGGALAAERALFATVVSLQAGEVVLAVGLHGGRAATVRIELRDDEELGSSSKPKATRCGCL